MLFDAGKLPLEENIKKTKEAVEVAKSINPEILVEAEIGYLGSSSVILKEKNQNTKKYWLTLMKSVNVLVY